MRITYDREVDALYFRFRDTTVTTKHLGGRHQLQPDLAQGATARRALSVFPLAMALRQDHRQFPCMTRHKIQIVTVMTVRIPLPHALSFGRINSAVDSRRSARSG